MADLMSEVARFQKWATALTAECRHGVWECDYGSWGYSTTRSGIRGRRAIR